MDEMNVAEIARDAIRRDTIHEILLLIARCKLNGESVEQIEEKIEAMLK